MLVKAYLHSSKEQMYDLGQSIGLTGTALERFQYTLLEVEFDLYTDPDSGDSTIYKVDGKCVEPYTSNPSVDNDMTQPGITT